MRQKRLTMKMVRMRSRRIALAFAGALTVLAAASIPAFTTDSVAVAVPPNTIVEYASLSLVADISDRQLTITRDGELIATYAVAVGKDRNPTPRGEFSIRKLVWNPGWVPPDAPWARGKKPKAPTSPGNPMKMVKLFFSEPDYYIHGTGEVESLGTAASHGCLRMSPTDVAEVARLVMESGGAEREESWFEKVMNNTAF